MSPTTIQLQSPFPPAECAARLVAAIDSERSVFWEWMGAASEKQVVGYVRGTSLRIRKREPGYYRNSFRVYLNAELLPAGAGTALTGTVGVGPSARKTETSTFVCLGLVGVLGMLLVSFDPGLNASYRQGGIARTFLLIWLLLVALAIYIAVEGRRSVRLASGFLTDFVARTLDAQASSPFPQP